jgi:hypothetical protein
MPNFTSEWLNEHERKQRNNQAGNRLPDTKPLERPETLVGGGEGKAQGTGRVALRFTLRRLRLLDPCAKYAGCKAIIDGCRYAGLIRNDSEKEITLEVNQEKVAHYKDEKTILEITYP